MAALKNLEDSGDDTDLLGLFSDDAELIRPELEESPGEDSDAASFWRSYLSPFNEIRTTFTHVDDSGHLAVLEWTSEGALAQGRPITYQGVSLLTYDGDRIRRFSTYFDTAAFVDSPRLPPAGTSG